MASPQFGDATSIQVSDARVTSDHSSYIGVIEALTREGFVIFVVEETLLNRIRILSRKDTTVRETIVSGSTGAILRDNTWQE